MADYDPGVPSIRALAVAIAVGLLAPLSAQAAEPMPTDCPPVFFADAGEVDCFRIQVPERHESPNGTSITLFVSILRATADDPRPDPVVYLAGGPGATAAEAASLLAGSSLRATRDIILFEQRGTALVDPYLGCPGLDMWEIVFSADPSTDESFIETIGTAARNCADAHEAAGTDLSAYTTAASATDLELVRETLGIERWNLYGGSYGTRLALEVLRSHGETVRSAVLDSVDPPGAPRTVTRTPNLAGAFDGLAVACSADGACSRRFGDLESLLQRALDRWRAAPTTVFAFYSDDAQTNVLVDPGAVASLVYSSLAGDPGGLPLLLEQLARGDTTILELTDLRPGIVSEGMRLSIECAESIPFIDGQELERNDASAPDLALAFRRFPEPAACPRWPVSRAEGDAVAQVDSDVPVLLVSGAVDPITPPSSAELAARTLSNARHHVVPGGGHGAGFADPCAIEVRDAFLEDPRAPSPSCDSTPTFLTDVVRHEPMAAAWRSVFASRPPRPSPLPAIAVVGIGLVLGFVGTLVAVVRGARGRAIWAVASGSAALLATGGFLAWLWLSHPPVVGMVGLPSPFGWAPWITSAASALGLATIAVLAIAAARARRRRRRLGLLASAVPVAAATWLLVANGLAWPFA